MILSCFTLGLLSAFALGPASFNVIRRVLAGQRFPWAEVAGFFLGDVIYLGLAAWLLQSPALQSESFRNALTLLTSLMLMAFSVKILWRKKQASVDVPLANQGFWRSLLLTLSNFHLLFLYTGIFAGFMTGDLLQLGVGIGFYLISFMSSFVCLLNILRHFQGVLQKILRPLEVGVSVGFILFSFYLTWGTL